MADAPARGRRTGLRDHQRLGSVFGAIGLATLGTIATDHSKALTSSGSGLAESLTGGYHLAYLVGAVAVAAGIVAAQLLLRSPSEPAAQATRDARAHRVRPGRRACQAGSMSSLARQSARTRRAEQGTVTERPGCCCATLGSPEAVGAGAGAEAGPAPARPVNIARVRRGSRGTSARLRPLPLAARRA